MKDILLQLFDHKSLTRQQAKESLLFIGNGQANPSQIAAFMTIFLMRSITVEELAGFRDAMLELCIPIDLTEFNPIDVCGTGGDNKDTFNISTLSMFITAGAGVKVAKHGNYAVSSASGSSNVLEALGIKFNNNIDFLKSCLEQSGVCILHAPLFHPAMKNVAPIRKELGVKTFFNILGPISNPAKPKRQLTGVFSLELARLYSHLFYSTFQRYAIVHSIDGYDEISLTGDFKLISEKKEVILKPKDLDKNIVLPESLYGGKEIVDSAKIFMDVLQGNGTPSQNDAVIANAGIAIWIAKDNISILDAQEEARESLISGKALKVLKHLQALCS